MRLVISQLAAGTEARLTFRLVKNHRDTQTTVSLLSVDLLTHAQPPVVTIHLNNDTAPVEPGSEPYRIDLLTNEPTVTETVAAAEGLVRLEAQIDDGPLMNITGPSPEAPTPSTRAPCSQARTCGGPNSRRLKCRRSLGFAELVPRRLGSPALLFVARRGRCVFFSSGRSRKGGGAD